MIIADLLILALGLVILRARFADKTEVRHMAKTMKIAELKELRKQCAPRFGSQAEFITSLILDVENDMPAGSWARRSVLLAEADKRGDYDEMRRLYAQF